MRVRARVIIVMPRYHTVWSFRRILITTTVESQMLKRGASI